MKPTPDEARVLERMRPGVLSREGFRGEDARPLSEIRAADDAAVERLGTTHEEIADALERVLGAARDELERPVRVHDRLVAAYREAKGGIPSPWPGEGVFPKGELTLTDPDTGRTWRTTPLSIHLIRAHGFYQGRGARYRIDPPEMARLLGLAKG